MQPGLHDKEEEMFVLNMTATMSNTVSSLFKWATKQRLVTVVLTVIVLIREVEF